MMYSIGQSAEVGLATAPMVRQLDPDRDRRSGTARGWSSDVGRETLLGSGGGVMLSMAALSPADSTRRIRSSMS